MQDKQFTFNYRGTHKEDSGYTFEGQFTMVEIENITFRSMKEKATQAAKESLAYDHAVDYNEWDIEVML